MSFDREEQRKGNFIKVEKTSTDMFLINFPGGKKVSTCIDKQWHIDLVYSKELAKKYWNVDLLEDEIEFRIEFKGRKRRNRYDSDYDNEWVFLELIGNYGYLGWLYGKSHVICFEYENEYMFTPTKELQNMIEAKMNITRSDVENFSNQLKLSQNEVSLFDKFIKIHKDRKDLENNGLSTKEARYKFPDFEEEIRKDLNVISESFFKRKINTKKELYTFYNRPSNLDMSVHFTTEEIKTISKIYKKNGNINENGNS